MEIPTLVATESMTAIAQWINSTFAQFDFKILEFYHSLHTGSAGAIWDFFFEKFTLLGEDGIFLILLGLFLMLFKKTRKTGICVVFAIGFGAVFTNLTIKELVARPRPYCANQTFQDWWIAVGHGLESEFSFPSGHTTASMAAMTSIFLNSKKKYISWLAFVFVIVMGASRNFLMVHYPSDIIGGIIVGGLAAVIAYILFSFIFNKLTKRESKLCRFIINFSVADIFKKKKA